MSSSIVTGSTIFAETASVMTLGIGTRNPEYPLDVKNTTAHGIRGMFGPHPTSSVTIWDGIYQANHPLRIKLPELDSSYFSISNKKPYGGISDDEYYQFVNFLELADYTADDNEAVYVMTNRSTYNSPYSHSAGITTFANLQDNLGGYVSSVYGNYNVLRTFGVGTTTNISTGLLSWTTVENSARVNTGYGFYGLLQLQTNATVGNYYNFFGVTQLGTGGSVSNLYGTYVSTAGNQSVSSIGNYAGLVSTTGTITASNNTLALLGTGIIPVGNYAIYNSSSYDNYFRGNVGIKTTKPSVALDINGDINISGSTRRIYADFSELNPISARTMFQSNVPNGISNVYVIPNGTGGASTFTVANDSNVDNSSIGQFIANATETSVRSNIVGNGTWLPFTIWTSGSERIKVDVLGNVGINQPNPAYKLDVNGSTNIVGDLIVGGLLTAVSTSIQYVTSSQLLIGDNRVVVNTNESLRFGGISVNDSGSVLPTSGSLYWDSLRNHWLYENASGQSYNSAILIAGPRNTGSLGNETELTPNKLVYAVGTDHIGDAPANTDGTNIFVENNLRVTGSLTVKQTGSFEGWLSASTVDISGLTTLRQVLEKATITPSGINGAVNYDLLSQAVWYYTADATSNWSVNFRGDSGNTLNSMMQIGQSLTSVLIIANGSPAFNPTAHSIDGITVTPKWQHGEYPSYGIPNSVEVYSYNIIKLADATFSIIASRTPYI